MYLYNLLNNQIFLNVLYSYKEGFGNETQYNLSISSKVATIIISGDTKSMTRG